MTQREPRPMVATGEHWKFAYNGFRKAWAEGDVEAMQRWTVDDEWARDYDPGWHARTDEIEKIDENDPELTSFMRWATSESTRRYHEETHAPPAELIEAGEASNWYSNGTPWHENRGRGPTSQTVKGRLARSTAGWTRLPTSEEFYDAARAVRPTRRQQAILGMFLTEATGGEWIGAWSEGAFKWRDMVRHGHAIVRPPDAITGLINGLATMGTTAKLRAFEESYMTVAWQVAEKRRTWRKRI